VTELTSTLEKLHRTFTGTTVTIESIKLLDQVQRRYVLDQLLADGVTLPTGRISAREPTEEPVSPHTGLPQKLRGAIHELTRNYPVNLIVDAAMLEVDEVVRKAIARAFLPKEPKEQERTLRDKLSSNADPKSEPTFTFVAESARGAMLGKANEAPPQIRIINGLTGRSDSYTLKRVVPEYDFREDENAPKVRQLAVYSKDGGQ
jgi:hypothetical protein